MRVHLKKKLIALIIVISLLIPAAILEPYSVKAASMASAAVYYVTDTLMVEMKSILNEQTTDGTRIGVVFYLSNQGKRITGLPEYEVRVKTNDGVEYSLRPSAVNASTILPKGKVELTYMVVVDREEPITLSDLFWVDVNPFVFPKKEITKLTIPISELQWYGESSSIVKPALIKTWGDTFTIPMQSPSLEYRPVNLSKQLTPKGNAMLVTLLVENKGTRELTIPDFRINGKSSRKNFNGKRVEQDITTIYPGDQQYIRYVIPTDNYEGIVSLNVLTPESFVIDDKKSIAFTIGRLSIQLPATGIALNQAILYERAKPIEFDPLNKLIPSNVMISLDELQMHESEGARFRTVVAKFMLQNRTDSLVTVPNFLAQLTSSDGYTYMGTRQNLTIQTLIPNISYVLYFYFIMPTSEQGNHLIMNMLDGDTAAPFHFPIASFQTEIQSNPDSSVLSLYPFGVKLNNWKITNKSSSDGSYTNQLVLDMDVLQGKSVVDQNFSKMQVEVLNKAGKVLTTEAFSFTGVDRLTSGDRFIDFKSKQYESNYTVKVYEVVDTPFGEAKRLLRTLQQ
jgi:hypothetical protein